MIEERVRYLRNHELLFEVPYRLIEVTGPSRCGEPLPGTLALDGVKHGNDEIQSKLVVLVRCSVFCVKCQDYVLGEIVIPEHGQQHWHGRVAACFISEKINLVFGTKAQIGGRCDRHDLFRPIRQAGRRQIELIAVDDPRCRAREFGKRHKKFVPLRGHEHAPDLAVS